MTGIIKTDELKAANTNLTLDTIANSDADIIFKGNDGGSTITALTLDMSDAGTAVFNHDITLPDNGKVIFGAGSDLQIYHNGNNSFIEDSGTGDLQIKATNISLRAYNNEIYLDGTQNGAVNIYYDNATKLATTSTGIDVTGTVTADDNFILEGSGGVNYKGHSRAFFGSLYSSHFAVLGSGAKADETANTQMIATETSTGNGLPSAIQLGAGNIDFHTIASSTANSAFDNKRMRIDKNGDISFYEDTGTTAKLFWDASEERLGIGTASPAAQLHVSGTAPITRLTETDNVASATNARIDFYGSDARSGYVGTVGGNLSLLMQQAKPITFGTSNTERMRITSDGKVGIGTSSPQDIIDIRGGSSSSFIFGTGGNSANSTLTLEFRDRYGASGFGQGQIASFIKNVRDGSSGDYDLAFGTNTGTTTNASERMRINSSGVLLVGITDANDISTTQGASITGAGAGITRSSGFPALTLRKLNNYQGEMIRFVYNGSTDVGSIDITSSSTSYNTSSDHRLKENVVEMTDATTRLKQLQPKRFNFIADADTTVDGFLAHEVQSVVPEAITGTHNEVDDDGNPVYQGIDQSKLVPLLVKTIQELEARITALESE